MNRDDMIGKMEVPGLLWDIIVIGGGASGLGIALEAVTRGYKTLLLEKWDFAKGTSSRSTKLIHGGVRYLAQGNISLVMEALRERGRLKRNASHLVKDLPFVIPCYTWWEIVMYTVGLTFYDLLAGRRVLRGGFEVLGVCRADDQQFALVRLDGADAVQRVSVRDRLDAGRIVGI